MKIDESLTSQLAPRSNNPSQEHLDFELWLRAPAKQSSGDEYYWQHQEQLQHSDVQFDSPSLISQHQKHEIALPPQLTKPWIEAQSRDLPINHHHNGAFETMTEPCVHGVESLTAFLQKEQKSSTTVVPYVSNNASLSVSENEVSDIVQTSSESRTFYTFKNHHLFIQGQSAELTLNKGEMDTQEEKEFIHTIKHLLKHKGIILNKLTINGVQHD